MTDFGFQFFELLTAANIHTGNGFPDGIFDGRFYGRPLALAGRIELLDQQVGVLPAEARLVDQTSGNLLNFIFGQKDGAQTGHQIFLNV